MLVHTNLVTALQEPTLRYKNIAENDMDQKAQEVLLEIRKSGRVTGLTLELAELVYKYPNSTVNELIEKASEIYPEKDKHLLVGLNKLPSVLKNKNIIKVGNKRHCKIKGTLAYELVPTYKT